MHYVQSMREKASRLEADACALRERIATIEAEAEAEAEAHEPLLAAIREQAAERAKAVRGAGGHANGHPWPSKALAAVLNARSAGVPWSAVAGALGISVPGAIQLVTRAKSDPELSVRVGAQAAATRHPAARRRIESWIAHHRPALLPLIRSGPEALAARAAWWQREADATAAAKTAGVDPESDAALVLGADPYARTALYWWTSAGACPADLPAWIDEV